MQMTSTNKKIAIVVLSVLWIAISTFSLLLFGKVMGGVDLENNFPYQLFQTTLGHLIAYLPVACTIVWLAKRISDVGYVLIAPIVGGFLTLCSQAFWRNVATNFNDLDCPGTCYGQYLEPDLQWLITYTVWGLLAIVYVIFILVLLTLKRSNRTDRKT